MKRFFGGARVLAWFCGLAFMAGAVSIAGGVAGDDDPASVYAPVTTFDPKRDAAKDIAEAVAEAARTGRRVILDVGGDWCIWCHRLDGFFADNEDVANFLGRHFVMVRVNWSRENKNEAVLSRYPKVAGYPHLFVLESDGSLLHSQDTGELEAGKGHDREKVLGFLKRWAPDSGG